MKQIHESLPVQGRALAAAIQPFEPSALCCFDEEVETSLIASNAEVVEVPLDTLHQRSVLPLDVPMPVISTPVEDRLLGTPET